MKNTIISIVFALLIAVPSQAQQFLRNQNTASVPATCVINYTFVDPALQTFSYCAGGTTITIGGAAGTVGGSGTFGQPAVWDGTNSIQASPSVRFADPFPGADAGAKIAAAIADLPATGGTVDARGLEGAQTISSDMFSGITKSVRLILGCANYTISATQNLPKSVSIEGCTWRGIASGSKGTILTAAFAGPVFSYSNSGVADPTDISISNMQILGDGATYGAGNGISINDASGGELRNITIALFGSDNIFIGSNSNNIYIRDTYSTLATDSNFYLNGAHISLIRASSDGGSNSVEIDSAASDVSILDSHFEGPSSAGLLISGATQTRINSNQFLMTNGGTGISITSGNRNILAANLLRGTIGTTGISVGATSIENEITGNFVTGFDIALDNSGMSVVSGNILEGDTTGLSETSHSTYYSAISGNYISGPTNSILHNSGNLVIYSLNRLADASGAYKALTLSAGSPTVVVGTGGGVGIGAGITTPVNTLQVDGGITVAFGSGVNFTGNVAGNSYLAIHSTTADAGLRFVGATDGRKLDFGSYTGDDSGNAWNSKVRIDSNTGQVLFAGPAILHQEVVTFSTTPAFDSALGNSFKMTLTDNVSSSTITNAQTGQFITLLLCQDAGGTNTMTWPANLKLAGGTFTLTATGSQCDSLTAVYDGSNWYETGRAANL